MGVGIVIVFFLCYWMPMDYLTAKKKFTHRFDFEIGYLVKSPCKDCDTIQCFPKCMDACDLLDEIHSILSEAISCTRN